MRPSSSLLGAVLLFACASLPRAGVHPPPPLLAPLSPAAAAAQPNVTVTASSSSVAAGETVTFTASVFGAVWTAPMTWAVSDGRRVTNSPGNVSFQFTSPGTFRVEASVIGDFGLAKGAITIQVTTPVVQRGCLPRPDWIWCDDFEDYRRMGAYFEYDDAGGRFVRRDSVGRNRSWGMAATFTPGRTGAGWLRVAFGRVPSTLFFPRVDTLGWRDSLRVGTETSRVRHREIWWRFWVRYPADWRGGGGNRLSAATIMADRSRAQAMVAFVWSPSTSPRPGALSIDAATGVDASGTVRTTRYEDFSRLRFLGSATGNTLFASPGDDRWHCVEGHARLNDAGRANAVFELFVDGKPEARREGFDWVRSYQQYGINAIVLDDLWPEGTPREQTRYLDDLAIGTARIGCDS